MDSPDNWAVVPKQPTKEMIDAACRSWENDQGPKSQTLWGSEAADIYRAMIAAAPKPLSYRLQIPTEFNCDPAAPLPWDKEQEH